mgnify:CR=1 FL=1
MNQSPLVALVGNPNAGKTALFNALTGARQKVGNYPGVTVERHAGRMAPSPIGMPYFGRALISLSHLVSRRVRSAEEPYLTKS